MGLINGTNILDLIYGVDKKRKFFLWVLLPSIWMVLLRLITDGPTSIWIVLRIRILRTPDYFHMDSPPSNG